MSTKAKFCTNCGAKPPKKTSIITWGVLAFILFIVYNGWQTESNSATTKIKIADEQRTTVSKVQVAANNNSTPVSAVETSSQSIPTLIENPKVTFKLDKAQEEVEAHFKGTANEPTSKDAVWTANNIFKVGVINDNTDRSGYAEYVCNVLYDYGFKGKKVWVQVIDIVKLTRTNKWEKLGESHCL